MTNSADSATPGLARPPVLLDRPATDSARARLQSGNWSTLYLTIAPWPVPRHPSQARFTPHRASSAARHASGPLAPTQGLRIQSPSAKGDRGRGADRGRSGLVQQAFVHCARSASCHVRGSARRAQRTNAGRHISKEASMRSIVIALLLAFLSGCASLVETRVSAFHEIQQPLSGVTYALFSSQEQEASLEFQSYSKLVKSELKRQGMIEAPSDKAKYAIFMFYGIDDGKQVVSSYPIFGKTGTSSAYTTGTITSYGNTASYRGTTYNTPTYGVVGSGTRTNTEFTRYLNLDIIDIAKSGNGKVKKVYEGKAVSSGSSSQLAPVMPAIVRSIFEDFPGTTGASRTSRQSLKK